MTTAGCLTIKHRENNGHESVIQARSVTYDDWTQTKNARVTAYGCPNEYPDGVNQYENGTVFVMNESGATVAKYDLHPRTIPHDAP